VSKIDPQGKRLLYSTYFGGSGSESFADTIVTSNAVHGHRIAVDADGNAYVAGDTDSPDLPVHNALQPAIGGDFDGFVAKFNPHGGLIYSSYFGGSQDDTARAITLDSSGNVYISGSTKSSADFPVLYSLQRFGGGTYDGFVAKMAITDTGGSLFFASYIGGSRSDALWEILVRSLDPVHSGVYVVGETESTDFPTRDAYQVSYAGGTSDGVFFKLTR
jgi:hypothetical protein